MKTQNQHNRVGQTTAWTISIAPKDFEAQREIEKQLSSTGTKYQLHTTAGVYCIWCGFPIDIVNDMRICNDGRILWLTKHCRKEYVVAFRVTNLDEETDLRQIREHLKERPSSPVSE